MSDHRAPRYESGTVLYKRNSNSLEKYRVSMSEAACRPVKVEEGDSEVLTIDSDNYLDFEDNDSGMNEDNDQPIQSPDSYGMVANDMSKLNIGEEAMIGVECGKSWDDQQFDWGSILRGVEEVTREEETSPEPHDTVVQQPIQALIEENNRLTFDFSIKEWKHLTAWKPCALDIQMVRDSKLLISETAIVSLDGHLNTIRRNMFKTPDGAKRFEGYNDSCPPNNRLRFSTEYLLDQLRPFNLVIVKGDLKRKTLTTLFKRKSNTIRVVKNTQLFTEFRYTYTKHRREDGYLFIVDISQKNVFLDESSILYGLESPKMSFAFNSPHALQRQGCGYHPPDNVCAADNVKKIYEWFNPQLSHFVHGPNLYDVRNGFKSFS